MTVSRNRVVLLFHPVESAVRPPHLPSLFDGEVLFEGLFKMGLVIIRKNILSGRKESLYLGIFFGDEFNDEGITTNSAEKMGDLDERQIIAES